jgi:hypothetical protein
MRRYHEDEMIRYSNYEKPEGDMVIRNGNLVPFDRRTALEMALEAHMLATGVRTPNAPKPASGG